MRLVGRSVYLAVVAVLCLATAVGAADAARIEGRILKDGEGVGGVAVLVNETKAIVFSEKDGAFVIEPIAAGTYTLILSHGENTMARPGVVVAADQTVDLTFDVEWDVGIYESVRVTAAKARAAKIVDAPAAVTSVSNEEITREASHGQLPKVLEFTPGAEVTQSGLYDFNFNTRGFNSSLNRRVSTYIDGRDVGVPLLGAQEWAAISIPLDDVGELEFVRGPSAALYGANASSGVINMTTKAPRDSLGGFVRMTTGDLGTTSYDFRQASSIGNDWYYKVVAGLRDTGDFSVSRNPDLSTDPEYSGFCNGVGEVDCLQKEKSLFIENDNEIRFGTLRVDRYFAKDRLLTLETGQSSIEGPAFQTGIGRIQILEARRPFARLAFSSERWSVLAHWANRDAHQVSLARNLRDPFFNIFSDTLRYGAEGQGHWNFGANDRGRLVVGAAYTEEEIDSQDPAGNQTIVNRKIDSDRQAIFGQFDWAINQHLKLVGAGRVDWNTLHKRQFSPKAAVVYTVNPSHSFRFTFNKAFQVANYSEFFLDIKLSDSSDFFWGLVTGPCSLGGLELRNNLPTAFFSIPQGGTPEFIQPGDLINEGEDPCFGEKALPGEVAPEVEAPFIKAVGNDDLDLEKTTSFEVGYSGILGKRAFLTLDYYNSENTDFITDLWPQRGTSLGVGCGGVPCSNLVNPDFNEWTGNEFSEALPGTITDPITGRVFTVAEAIRSSINQVFGELNFPDPTQPGFLGFQFAEDLNDPDSTIFVARTYANVGQVDTQGIDLGLTYFVNDQWNLRTSFSWFDFEVVDAAPEVLEILLPNTPEFKGSLSVIYTRPVWDASLSGRWNDDFRWSAGVYQGDVPSYTLVDFAVNVSIGDSVKVGVNVANLFDNVHRQTFGGDLLSRRALLNTKFAW